MKKPILFVVAPYYTELSEMLVTGASAALYNAGRDGEIVSVPGALEIPAAIAIAAQSRRYAGYVALGCVIRGETTHYEIVSNESARALQELGIRQHLAIGNAILTCENMQQATVRADPAQGNKGGEAVLACLKLIELRETFGLEDA
jgi:6,7-dimethyl-8-ribityllumazine synthase